MQKWIYLPDKKTCSYSGALLCCSAWCVLKAQNIDIQHKQWCTSNGFPIFTEEQQGPKINLLNDPLSPAGYKSCTAHSFTHADSVDIWLKQIFKQTERKARTHPVLCNSPCISQCCCDKEISGFQSPSSSRQKCCRFLASKTSQPPALPSRHWLGHTSTESPFQSDPINRRMRRWLLQLIQRKANYCCVVLTSPKIRTCFR